MFPLQITNRKWRKWKFVDGFHRLPDSSSLFHVHGSTLSDRYYCEFLWSWEKFLWRWSTVQPKMRYATVVVKVHAGKTTKWAHALMIGKESLKGWWILTTLKKWTGWAQALFWKVVGDRFYSSSVPKYIYFVYLPEKKEALSIKSPYKPGRSNKYPPFINHFLRRLIFFSK